MMAAAAAERSLFGSRNRCVDSVSSVIAPVRGPVLAAVLLLYSRGGTRQNRAKREIYFDSSVLLLVAVVVLMVVFVCLFVRV